MSNEPFIPDGEPLPLIELMAISAISSRDLTEMISSTPRPLRPYITPKPDVRRRGKS